MLNRRSLFKGAGAALLSWAAGGGTKLVPAVAGPVTRTPDNMLVLSALIKEWGFIVDVRNLRGNILDCVSRGDELLHELGLNSDKLYLLAEIGDNRAALARLIHRYNEACSAMQARPIAMQMFKVGRLSWPTETEPAWEFKTFDPAKPFSKFTMQDGVYIEKPVTLEEFVGTEAQFKKKVEDALNNRLVIEHSMQISEILCALPANAVIWPRIKEAGLNIYIPRQNKETLAEWQKRTAKIAQHKNLQFFLPPQSFRAGNIVLDCNMPILHDFAQEKFKWEDYVKAKESATIAGQLRQK